MTRLVNCVKLKKEAEGLDRAPYPGELGKKVYENVSKEAWQQWIQMQTMLINEYRLVLVEAKSRKYLAEEMEKFLFTDNSEPPQHSHHLRHKYSSLSS